jgi:sugar O-acyltransferase (sialic acid O-acetyltransferase NeuD family)
MDTTAPTRLMIVGAGGFGRQVAHLVNQINERSGERRFEIVGFLLDHGYELDPVAYHYPVHRGIDEFDGWRDTAAVCAIGDPAARRTVVARLDEKSVRWAQLISKCFDHGTDSVLGEGLIVETLSGVGVNASIGRHVHVQAYVSVAHDCRVGSFVTLGTHAAISGRVTIEDDVSVGSHVVVLPGLRVGRGAKLMAGCVIVRDVPPNAVMFGNPARQLNV